jgi:hypothetical protein
MAIMQPPTWARSSTGLSGFPFRARTRALLDEPYPPDVVTLKQHRAEVVWNLIYPPIRSR